MLVMLVGAVLVVLMMLMTAILIMLVMLVSTVLIVLMMFMSATLVMIMNLMVTWLFVLVIRLRRISHMYNFFQHILFTYNFKINLFAILVVLEWKLNICCKL